MGKDRGLLGIYQRLFSYHAAAKPSEGAENFSPGNGIQNMGAERRLGGS